MKRNGWKVASLMWRRNMRVVNGWLEEVPEGVTVLSGAWRVRGSAMAGGRRWLVVSDGRGLVGVVDMARLTGDGAVEPLRLMQLDEDPMCVVSTADGEVTLMTVDGPVFMDYETDEGETLWRYRGGLGTLPEVAIEAVEGEMMSMTVGSVSLSGGDLRDGLTSADRKKIGGVVASGVNELIRRARAAGYCVMPVETRWLLTDRRGNIVATGERAWRGGIDGGMIRVETSVDSSGRTGAITIGLRPTRLRLRAGGCGEMGGNWSRHIGEAIAEAGGEPEWKVSAESMMWRIEQPGSGEARLVMSFEAPKRGEKSEEKKGERRMDVRLSRVARVAVDMTEERSVDFGPGGEREEREDREMSDEERLIAEVNERGFSARRGLRYGDTIVWADITVKDGERHGGLVMAARSPKGLTVVSMADSGDEVIEALAGAARRMSTWGFGSGHVYGLSRTGVAGISVSGVKRTLSVTRLTGDGTTGGEEREENRRGVEQCVAPTADGVAIITTDGSEVALISGTGRRSLKRRTDGRRYVMAGYDGRHNELMLVDDTGAVSVMELDNGTEREQTTGVEVRYMAGVDGHLYVSDGQTRMVDTTIGRKDVATQIAAEYEAKPDGSVGGVAIEMTAGEMDGSIEVGGAGGVTGSYACFARYGIKGQVRSTLRMRTPMLKRDRAVVKINAAVREMRMDKIAVSD